MKKLTLNKNDKFYLDFFSLNAKELYKIDKKYDENIDIFLDNIFNMLLNSYHIRFQEKYI